MGSWANAWEQRRGVAALCGYVARSAASSVRPRALSAGRLQPPFPRFEGTVPSPSKELVRAFASSAGGNPQSYSQCLPPHMFSQWTLPLMLQAAEYLAYPAWTVINAGCRFEVFSPLPYGKLDISAQVASVAVGERRTRIVIETTTAPHGGPVALQGEVHIVVNNVGPKSASKSDGRRKPSSVISVPHDATELWFGRIGADAGKRFASVSGDLNPIHWLPLAAKAAGFRGVILQGFASLARCVEALVLARLSGDVRRIREVEARFVRPLLLPAQVGVYLRGSTFFLGDAPDGVAYVEGAVALSEASPVSGGPTEEHMRAVWTH